MNDHLCTYDAPLTDAQLMMALDDQAASEVAMHLSHCPACQAQARRLNGQQQVLAHALFRIVCPTPLELGEYQLGLLPPERSIAIARHVSVCPHCTAETDALIAFMAQPEPLAQPTRQELARERLRVKVAQLVSGARGVFAPSALAPAFAALRGDSDGPLTYEAGDAQIILDIQDDEQWPGHKTVVGLLLGVAAQNLTAHLWRDQRSVGSVEVDPLGNFSFENLAPGQYELFVTGEMDEIHVQDLTL